MVHCKQKGGLPLNIYSRGDPVGGALVISGLVLFLGGLIPTKQINFYKNIIKVYTHKIHVSKVKIQQLQNFSNCETH